MEPVDAGELRAGVPEIGAFARDPAVREAEGERREVLLGVAVRSGAEDGVARSRPPERDRFDRAARGPGVRKVGVHDHFNLF